MNGLGGFLVSSFAYTAAPEANPAELLFANQMPGQAVIGPVGGPDLWGKTVQLSVSLRASMSDLVAGGQSGSFSQSFAGQGSIGITGLDTFPGNLNLLSGAINGGKIQVDIATRRAVVELHLTQLTSQSLYLTGQPATLKLEGMLSSAAVLGNCVDYAYKVACMPGEQFLDDFSLTPLQGGTWSVSTNAFVATVPEPASAALVLMGSFAVLCVARRRSGRQRGCQGLI